jgi:hypothetical protein
MQIFLICRLRGSLAEGMPEKERHQSLWRRTRGSVGQPLRAGSLSDRDRTAARQYLPFPLGAGLPHETHSRLFGHKRATVGAQPGFLQRFRVWSSRMHNTYRASSVETSTLPDRECLKSCSSVQSSALSSELVLHRYIQPNAGHP